MRDFLYFNTSSCIFVSYSFSSYFCTVFLLQLFLHRISTASVKYNPQIQFFAKSETKRPKIELSYKTKRSKNHKRTTPKMQPFLVVFLVYINRLK